jgi:hypothetical protein
MIPATGAYVRPPAAIPASRIAQRFKSKAQTLRPKEKA